MERVLWKKAAEFLTHPANNPSNYDGFWKNVGTNVSIFRQRTGHSISKMALKLGMTPLRLSMVEKGVPVDFYTLFRISNFLNISVSDLISANASDLMNIESSRPVAEFVRKFHLTVEEQRMLINVGKAIFRYKSGNHSERTLIKALVSQYKVGD